MNETNTSIDQHEGKKYIRRIKQCVPLKDDEFYYDGIYVDVYSVLEAFNVTCPAIQHAIKKLLCCGIRNKGNKQDDLTGALAAINRAIELEKQRK